MTPPEIDMDEVRISAMPGEPDEVMLFLPSFTYLDTQAFAVDVGVPRALLPEIVAAIEEQHPDQLTGEEARAEVDRLSTELYRAQDAVAFVREMCDIADREELEVTTTRVRSWLEGPKCARMAALVLPAVEGNGS